MDHTFEFDPGAAGVESVAGVAETIDVPQPQTLGTAKTAASNVASLALLERLLVMAQRYRKEMNPREAIELFWSLAEEHPDTPQAEAARLELQELAEGYERAGNQHTARSMYERLLDLEN